jgi:hypothetical protein
MDALKMLNLAVRFLLELCMLAAVAFWGFKTQNNWLMKILLGIGLPVLIAVLWGMFLAPKATHRLSGAPFFALELALFSTGAFSLFAGGAQILGWAYTITLIVNTILLVVWKQ